MVGAEVDHVRLASLVGERLGETFQRRIRRRLVLAERKGVQRCAEEAVEQHVAGGAVQVVGVVHPFLELYVDVHAELARPGRGETHEIGLHRAGDEHRVGGLRPRLAEVELELAHLVPTEGEPRAVVALDPQLDAERRREIRSRVERGRRVAEPSPWKPVDSGERSWHDASGGAKNQGSAMIPNANAATRASAIPAGWRRVEESGGWEAEEKMCS